MTNDPTPRASPPSSAIASQIAVRLADLSARWKQLGPAGRRTTALTLLLTACATAGCLWFLWRPHWKTLYSGLDPNECREIAASLAVASITYDVTANGTALSVPAELLDKARLASAAKVTGTSTRVGFEVFDKANWAGSDFDEKVNYERALEGELEHTIETIDGVRVARVHLVLPHDSLFAAAQRDAKASVVIHLKSRNLGEVEAQSIRSLVASAVDGLKPENVTLIDGDGGGSLGEARSTDPAARTEQALAQRIVDTIEPVVGAGNVRASVDVEYELSSRDEVDEKYDPVPGVTLSMQRSEDTAGDPPSPGGVPGTASNAPNQQAPLFPAQKALIHSSKEESGVYGASKKTQHFVEGPGRVGRITAAVLINDASAVNGSGGAGSQGTHAWGPAQIANFRDLAQAAVGYQEARGDRVVVAGMSFEVPVTHKAGLAEKYHLQASWIEPLVRDCLTGLIAILALFVFIKPVVFSGRIAGSASPVRSQLPGTAIPSLEETLLQSEEQGRLDQVVTQIDREPSQSARLLQPGSGKKSDTRHSMDGIASMPQARAESDRWSHR